MISIWGVNHGTEISKGAGFSPERVSQLRSVKGLTSRGVRRAERQAAHRTTFNRAVSSGNKTRASQWSSNKMQLSGANASGKKWGAGDSLHPYLQSLKKENSVLGAGRGK